MSTCVFSSHRPFVQLAKYLPFCLSPKVARGCHVGESLLTSTHPMTTQTQAAAVTVYPAATPVRNQSWAYPRGRACEGVGLSPKLRCRRRNVGSAVEMATSGRSGGASMGDVKYWDSSYLKALDDLERFINTAEESTGEAGEEALASAAQTMKRLGGMKRSYNVEIKLMSDAAAKAHYNLEKSTKDKRLADLQARLEAAEANAKSGGATKAARDELFSGRRDIESGAGGTQTAEVKLAEAESIQDKTEDAYKNMIGVLQETEQTAGATAAELANQREQIGRITDDAIEVETLLTRADRLVKVFSKRMMTDKFIQCFGCLNVIALLAIILYVLIENVGLPSSGTTEDPPDPSE